MLAWMERTFTLCSPVHQHNQIVRKLTDIDLIEKEQMWNLYVKSQKAAKTHKITKYYLCFSSQLIAIVSSPATTNEETKR